jgi:hypothetical protein
MKRTRKKMAALLIVLAVPGMSLLSCSTTIMQEFRDAAIRGGANAIEVAATQWLTGWIPDFNAE